MLLFVALILDAITIEQSVESAHPLTVVAPLIASYAIDFYVSSLGAWMATELDEKDKSRHNIGAGETYEAVDEEHGSYVVFLLRCMSFVHPTAFGPLAVLLRHKRQ